MATAVSGQTQSAIAAADLAITKSTPSTQKLPLLNVPQVVLYRVSPRMPAWDCPYFLEVFHSLYMPPNLVEMKSHCAGVATRASHGKYPTRLPELLSKPSLRQQTLADYQQMRQSLGTVGVSDRAA